MKKQLNNYNSIIDDCRFKHDYLLNWGFILIKIEQYIENNNNYIFNHIFEIELKNNEYINSLCDKIKKMINELLFEYKIELISLSWK